MAKTSPSRTVERMNVKENKSKSIEARDKEGKRQQIGNLFLISCKIDLYSSSGDVREIKKKMR